MLREDSKNISSKVKSREENIEIAFYIVWVILVIGAVFHTISTREFQQWFKYSLGTGIFIASVIISVVVVSVWKNGLSKPRLSNVIVFLFMPLICLLAGLTHYSVAASLKDLFLLLLSFSITKSGSILLTVLVTLIVGILLFLFRLKLRSTYGFVELLTGLLVAWHQVTEYNFDLKTPEFYLAILTAGVFLVVRGCDNIYIGLNNEPKDRLALKIFQRFYQNKSEL